MVMVAPPRHLILHQENLFSVSQFQTLLKNSRLSNCIEYNRHLSTFSETVIPITFCRGSTVSTQAHLAHPRERPNKSLHNKT